MKEESYEVGQVIYLLSLKNTKVFPAKITEEIIRKTIDKSLTDYMILLPDKNGTIVKLRDIGALAFSSIEKLREYMNENAKKSIDSMISLAVENANTIFNSGDLESDSSPQIEVARKNIEKKSNDNGIDSSEYVSIQLQDGKKARINIENLNKMGL